MEGVVMLINKKVTKIKSGGCQFCDESDYAVLDCHRIVPGEDGGRYTMHNTIVACANCHRKVHDGQIKIDKKYSTSGGGFVLHYWENDKEHWEEC